MTEHVGQLLRGLSGIETERTAPYMQRSPEPSGIGHGCLKESVIKAAELTVEYNMSNDDLLALI